MPSKSHFISLFFVLRQFLSLGINNLEVSQLLNFFFSLSFLKFSVYLFVCFFRLFCLQPQEIWLGLWLGCINIYYSKPLLFSKRTSCIYSSHCMKKSTTLEWQRSERQNKNEINDFKENAINNQNVGLKLKSHKLIGSLSSQ